VRAIQHLAYETALRALDEQERHFDGLRFRAGALLAASSIAMTVFVPETNSSFFRSSALISYLVCAGATVYVLTPSRALAFSPSPSSVSRLLTSEDREVVGLVGLTSELDGYRARNGRIARKQVECCRLAAYALGLETLLLVVTLSDSIV
jgi:hypothetical protein